MKEVTGRATILGLVVKADLPLHLGELRLSQERGQLGKEGPSSR